MSKLFKTDQQLGMWVAFSTVAINTIKTRMLSVAKHQIELMSSWPGGLNLGATKGVIRKDVREARHQLQYFVAEELKLSTTRASISGSFRSSASLVISSRPSVSRMREQQLTSTDPKCKATSCHITCNPDSLSLEGKSCDL